jgi:hypothetical protein
MAGRLYQFTFPLACGLAANSMVLQTPLKEIARVRQFESLAENTEFCPEDVTNLNSSQASSCRVNLYQARNGD